MDDTRISPPVRARHFASADTHGGGRLSYGGRCASGRSGGGDGGTHYQCSCRGEGDQRVQGTRWPGGLNGCEIFPGRGSLAFPRRPQRVCVGRGTDAELAVMARVGSADGPAATSTCGGASSLVPRCPAADVYCSMQANRAIEIGRKALGCWRWDRWIRLTKAQAAPGNEDELCDPPGPRARRSGGTPSGRRLRGADERDARSYLDLVRHRRGQGGRRDAEGMERETGDGAEGGDVTMQPGTAGAAPGPRAARTEPGGGAVASGGGGTCHIVALPLANAVEGLARGGIRRGGDLTKSGAHNADGLPPLTRRTRRPSGSRTSSPSTSSCSPSYSPTAPEDAGAFFERRSAGVAVIQCTRTAAEAAMVDAALAVEFRPGPRGDDPTVPVGRAGPCGARKSGAARGRLVPKCGAPAWVPPVRVLLFAFALFSPVPILDLLPTPTFTSTVFSEALCAEADGEAASDDIPSEASGPWDLAIAKGTAELRSLGGYRLVADRIRGSISRSARTGRRLYTKSEGAQAAYVDASTVGGDEREEGTALGTIGESTAPTAPGTWMAFAEQGVIMHARTQWRPLTTRIGEAANPGPPAMPDIATRLPTDDADVTIRYPAPHERGLSHVVAPGFAARPQAPLPHTVDKEQFQLVIETVNTTGWKALRKRLMASDAHVILAQETWITQAAVPGASVWAKKRGWRSVWSAAATTERGGTAAGVAIFAKEFLGLSMPANQPHEVIPSRVVAATLETPDSRALHLMSCYLKHGRGVDEENAEILAAIGAAAAANGNDEVTVAAGDFNMAPQQLLGTEFDRAANLTVFHGDLERGTYRTAKTSSTLDYFLIADRLAAAVSDVAVVEASGVKGHAPVQLRFKPRLAQLKALHLRMPPRLATERVYGPLQPPPRWEAPLTLAKAALEAARADARGTDDAIEAAYAAWADLAETELEQYSGTLLKKRGERAKRPRLVWRSVMPEKRVKPSFPRAAALQWLRGIAMELQRIARIARAAAAGGTAPSAGTGAGANGAIGIEEPCGDDEAEDTACDDNEDDLTYATQSTAEAFGRILTAIRSSLDADIPEGDPTVDFVTRWNEVRNMTDAAIAAVAQADAHWDPCMGNHPADDAERAAGGMRRIAAALSEGTNNIQRLREDLDADTTRATAAEDAEDARHWRAWLEEDFRAGASRAHAYSRLPQQALPTAAKLPGGAVSAAPEALLDEQRCKYRALWKPSPRPYSYSWHDVSELPILSAEQLREAARSFKERTSITFDGFHPRHLGDLSDDALCALAYIFQATEVCGRWPRQLRLVATALLPKPKGGGCAR